MLLVLGLLTPAPGAHASSAANDGALLQLTSTTPAVVGPGTDLTVTGRVLNRSSTTLPSATVTLDAADRSLNTRTLVADWYDGRSALTGAARVGTADIAALGPGQAASFQVTVSADALPGSGRNRATVPLQATYAGTGTAPVRTRTTVIRTAANLTWQTPLQVSWLVPLTLPADARLFAKDDKTRLAGWRAAIGPGSRIDTLMTQLEGREVTWLLDPSVLNPVLAPDEELPRAEPSTAEGDLSTDEPQSPAPSTAAPTTSVDPSSSAPSGSSAAPTTPDPSPASGADDTPAPTTPSPTPSSSTPTPDSPTQDESVETLVDALRARLQQRSGEQPVLTLPTGDPDLASVSRLGGADAVRRQLDLPTPASVEELTSEAPLQWPAEDIGAEPLRTTTAAWRSVRGERPTTVLSTRSLDGRSPSETTTAARRLSDGTPVLTYDEAMTTAASSADPATRTPRVLAESLAAYLEAPDTRRSVLVMAPRTPGDAAGFADVVASTDAAPWVQGAPVGALLTAAAKAPADASVVGTDHRASSPPALNRARWSQAGEDRLRLRGLSGLLVDSDDVIDGWSDGLAQRTSMRWRGHAAALDTVAGAQHDALVAVPQQVFVRPSSINFFTDSSDVGVLVVNQLNRPVHNVQLRLTPRRYVIEVEKQAAPVQIAADSRASARVSLRAVAAGQVRVDARLSTTDGMPLGPQDDAPAQLSLNVRPTGSWMYWALGLIAGPIAVVGVYRTLRRGPRPTTEVTTPPGVQPTDPADPAPTGTDHDGSDASTEKE